MSFSKIRTQPHSSSFFFFGAEDEVANVKVLAIEEDICTIPFNTKHEQRGRGAESVGARRKNNENDIRISDESSIRKYVNGDTTCVSSIGASSNVESTYGAFSNGGSSNGVSSNRGSSIRGKSGFSLIAFFSVMLEPFYGI